MDDEVTTRATLVDELTAPHRSAEVEAAGGAPRVTEIPGPSEEYFHLLFEHSPDAIFLIDPHHPSGSWPIVACNEAAARMNGYTCEELIGQSMDILTVGEAHTDAPGRGPFVEQLRREGTVHGEGVHRRKDGTIFPIEFSTTLVTLGGRELVLGIDRDITERQRIEAEREALFVAAQEQSRRLRELAALKADFTAMVAHELMAPIAAIGGFARMAASGKLSAAEQQEALAAIRAEVAVLAKLVADVRGSARVERDDFQVQVRRVSLSSLLEDAAAFGRGLPDDHPLELTVSGDVQVLADPTRIGQVLRNLLSNAAKYSSAGSPIELRAVVDGARARVEVVDQGHGIHPDDLDRIFEKFGRGRDLSGDKVAGVGLGLYLSRRIVQAHGSDLTVASAPGEGSIFSFELEVAP